VVVAGGLPTVWPGIGQHWVGIAVAPSSALKQAELGRRTANRARPVLFWQIARANLRDRFRRASRCHSRRARLVVEEMKGEAETSWWRPALVLDWRVGTRGLRRVQMNGRHRTGQRREGRVMQPERRIRRGSPLRCGPTALADPMTPKNVFVTEVSSVTLSVRPAARTMM
jgi:hypothetical protein